MADDDGKLSTHIGTDEVIASSELVGRIEKGGTHRVLARQWMRRASTGSNGIWRSEHLELSGGGRLFAKRSSVGTPAFLAKAADCLAVERPGLARVIRRLLGGGVILRNEAERLLASPLNGKSPARFCSYDRDVASLEELRAGVVDGLGTALERIAKPSIAGGGGAHALALRQHAELLIAGQLARMLVDEHRRQGLIAWNGHVVPESGEALIDFNNFGFSAAGFSWLSPLLRWRAGSEKPTSSPVVYDVYARRCDEGDVEAFAQRIQRASGHPRNGMKILGVLAAVDLTKPAWSISKERGFLTINLRQTFGEAAVKAIEQIRELLSYVSGDPDRVEEKDIDSLAVSLDALRTNPYVTDLKSIALEMWAALYLRAKGYEDVHTNLMVPFGSTRREVDASGTRPASAKVYVIECKAELAGKTLDPEYVRKFYTETMPAYLKARWASGDPLICKAEIWTTGKVGEAAEAKLKELNLRACVRAKLVDGAALEAMVPASLNGAKRLLKTIAVG